MGTFLAGTQYGDWKGTVVADGESSISFEEHLEKNGLKKDGEFLIAISFWAGENKGGELGLVSVRAYLYDGPEALDEVKAAIEKLGDDEPIPVRIVDVPLSLEEFICLFKRFDVMLCWRGLQGTIQGREFRETFVQ
jgi:hypothetical protein